MDSVKVYLLDRNSLNKNISRNLTETQALIEVQLFHPISNFKFVKLLKNNLIFEENENSVKYQCEFQGSELLFDVGTFIIPLNFFRISVKLTTFSNKSVIFKLIQNNRRIESIVYIPECLKSNSIKITSVRI
mgnify:CR=1 FL=1